MNNQYNIPKKQPSKNNSEIELVTDLESIAFTWERLIPKQMPNDPASKRFFNSHIKRYETAMLYVKGKRVLDIACGAGYGSQMLALAGASTVVGVDICPDTVQYAKKHYHQNNVMFICADALTFEWHEQFDVIVSFETIEHVPDPEKLLARFRRLLIDEGNLLLSVPLGETRHIDRYHLHKFSQEDVFALLEKAGYWIDQYYCDDLYLTRIDLLRWRQLYPEARPSLYEQFCTRKGWQLVYDFVFQGIINIPALFVATRVINNQTVQGHGSESLSRQ